MHHYPRGGCATFPTTSINRHNPDLIHFVAVEEAWGKILLSTGRTASSRE